MLRNVRTALAGLSWQHPGEKVGVGFLALAIWAEMDIAGAPLHQLRTAYNAVWYLALLGFVLILGVAYRSIALPLGVLLWSSDGGEDTLYFWLQFRAVPSRLPGLDGHALILQPPTDVSVIAGFAIGLVVLIGAVVLEELVAHRYRRSRSQESQTVLRPKAATDDPASGGVAPGGPGR
jgi:hypothetical protein